MYIFTVEEMWEDGRPKGNIKTGKFVVIR